MPVQYSILPMPPYGTTNKSELKLHTTSVEGSPALVSFVSRTSSTSQLDGHHHHRHQVKTLHTSIGFVVECSKIIINCDRGWPRIHSPPMSKVKCNKETNLTDTPEPVFLHCQNETPRLSSFSTVWSNRVLTGACKRPTIEPNPIKQAHTQE